MLLIGWAEVGPGLRGVRPVLVEMGARIGGGGFMHHLVHLSSGIELAAEAMRIHLGRPPRPGPSWTVEQPLSFCPPSFCRNALEPRLSRLDRCRARLGPCSTGVLINL
ncbi:hypothetical protein GCM10022420_038270 [Streptomyces iranensis]